MFLQKKNVCHCDIKPGNILLHEDSDEKHFKVCDVGSSLIME